jgi:hypothetical protein
MHALNGMRTRNPSNQAAVDLRLGPHGHRYQISQTVAPHSIYSRTRYDAIGYESPRI